MSREGERAALAAAIEAGVERILSRLALEAARASSSEPMAERSVIAAYTDWMRAFVPGALEAVAAPDPEREVLLQRWVTSNPPRNLRSVPPVARRGLFALGVRLAREEIAVYRRATGRSGEALENELDRFATAVSTVLVGRSIGVT